MAKWDGVLIDLEGYTLRNDRDRLPLTATERDVLSLLILRSGQSVSRDEILDQIWGPEATIGHSNVDNVVARLRAKLDFLDGTMTWISTVRGTGYRWSR